MKSYFAYLGNGCYNYAEEKVDGGTVDVIQKGQRGQRYYFLTHASSINALTKCHQIESLEIYDKVTKLVSMNLAAFNSILKNNIGDEGPGVAELYPNGTGVALKDVHISITSHLISIGSREDVIFFLDPRNRISEETFQRLLTLTENTLKQIDDIWKTI